jgi:hypothetical protein
MLGILGKFFADPDLPPDVRALERQAYCNAHWGMVLEYHYWRGRIPEARESLREALEWASPQGEGAPHAINGLVHAAQVSRGLRGPSFVERFLSDMGQAAAELEPLKSQIMAQVYLAQASQNQQAAKTWTALQDTARAVGQSPSSLAQKRFYTTLLKIVLGRRVTMALRSVRRRLFRQEYPVVVGDLS